MKPENYSKIEPEIAEKLPEWYVKIRELLASESEREDNIDNIIRVEKQIQSTKTGSANK